MQKRAMTILAVFAMFGLIASAAWAGPWGHRYYDNGGPNNEAFLEKTADLRAELAGKRGEYQALMVQENPDPQRAAQLQKEIAQLREQIRTTAQDYADTSGYGRYYDRGYDHQRGWGHRGGYCW